MELDFRPGHEVFWRWLGGALAWRSNNVELNVSVRTRQAMALLVLVMVVAVVAGFGELSRQKHHREAGRGSVMDGFWERAPHPDPPLVKGRENLNQLQEHGNGK